MPGGPLKVVLLIDGGWLRARVEADGLRYRNDLIEKFVQGVMEAGKSAMDGEWLMRVLYYDCPKRELKTRWPVSGRPQTFKGTEDALSELATRDLFAVRKGFLRWTGFRVRKAHRPGTPLTDADYSPHWEQKGVDLRIGLDIAAISYEKTVDRILLCAGDTDLIPALKLARRSGLQIVLIQPPNVHRFSRDLLEHADLCRKVPWPAMWGTSEERELSAAERAAVPEPDHDGTDGPEKA